MARSAEGEGEGDRAGTLFAMPPRHRLLSSLPEMFRRNAGGAIAAETKECLTKLKKGEASVTKLSWHPRVLPCAAATNTPSL
jgi:hypothetical protein